MATRPSIESVSFNSDASPAAATKEIFRAPYGCKIVGYWAKRTGGTGAVVNAQVTRSGVVADLCSADKSLTTTAYVAGTLDSAQVTLLAGDIIVGEIVSVAGSPTAVRIQIDIQYNTDAR